MKIFVTGASGFIGGSVAARLQQAGHQVVGLTRSDENAAALLARGIEPIQGSLDDEQLLMEQARQADAVVNAADSDHLGAIEALVGALAASGKPLLHTSGSSIVADHAKGEAGEAFHHSIDEVAPLADKAPRVAIDKLVCAAAGMGVRSVVLCNTLIYGHGRGIHQDSVQIPALVAQAQKSGIVRHVGRGLNVWSNVHVDDMADLYLLALEKAPAGAFYFVENGEASYADLSNAIARKLGLGRQSRGSSMRRSPNGALARPPMRLAPTAGSVA